MQLLIFGVALTAIGLWITADSIITMRRARADPGPCGQARVFLMPDGTSYATTSFLKINEFDPGPSQECLKMFDGIKFKSSG